MSNSDKKSKSNINIEIDEKTAEGTYSNLAIINHSVSEFVLDFICIMPGTPKNKVKSRIIITPQHAKRRKPPKSVGHGTTWNLLLFFSSFYRRY